MNALLRALRRRWDRRLRDPLSLRLEDGTWWDKDQVGKWGEELAAFYLQVEGGCRLLRRNFRAPQGGEVDIVCRDRETLVFAEVKTRTSNLFGRPAAAVTREKQELIIRGAREWLRLLGKPDVIFRFDIVEVELRHQQSPEVNWLRGAFHLPEPWFLRS